MGYSNSPGRESETIRQRPRQLGCTGFGFHDPTPITLVVDILGFNRCLDIGAKRVSQPQTITNAIESLARLTSCGISIVNLHLVISQLPISQPVRLKAVARRYIKGKMILNCRL